MVVAIPCSLTIEVLRRTLESAQCTSIEFGQRCRDAGVRRSMGSAGDAYDNAMCESFFATLECELLARSRFRTPAEARSAVFSFIGLMFALTLYGLPLHLRAQRARRPDHFNRRNERAMTDDRNMGRAGPTEAQRPPLESRSRLASRSSTTFSGSDRANAQPRSSVL